QQRPREQRGAQDALHEEQRDTPDRAGAGGHAGAKHPARQPDERDLRSAAVGERVGAEVDQRRLHAELLEAEPQVRVVAGDLGQAEEHALRTARTSARTRHGASAAYTSRTSPASSISTRPTIRHVEPYAIEKSGRSLFTTELAPTTQCRPMRT